METRSPSVDARRAYAIGIAICAAVLIGFALIAAIEPTFAAEAKSGDFGLKSATPSALKKAGSSVPVIIGRVISAALGMVSVVFLLLMLYAGFMWMTARGNAERAEKAKDTIGRAIIGIIIIASAYAITSFVITRVTTDPTPEPTTETTTDPDDDDSGHLQETINRLAGIQTVHAQGLGTGNLQEVGKVSGISKTPSESANQLPVIVGNFVRAFISILGVIFLFLTVYGGFLWLTARGEADRVDKAKSTLSRAVIGLIIILSAYAISSFVLSRIITATTAS